MATAVGPVEERTVDGRVRVLLPVLLIVVLAVIEFCVLIFGLSSARYAAGEGARAASEAGSNASADSLAVAAIRGTGLGSTRAVSVSEVDIYKVDVVNGNLQQDSVLINLWWGWPWTSASGTTTTPGPSEPQQQAPSPASSSCPTSSAPAAAQATRWIGPLGRAAATASPPAHRRFQAAPAVDTITVTVSLRGAPAHLLSS